MEDIRKSGDQELECAALRFLGRLELAEGKFRQAKHTYQDVIAIAKAEGFEGVLAGQESDLAYWEMKHGTLAEAEKHIREAIRGFEELNDIVRVSDRSMMLANILIRQEKYSEAIDQYLGTTSPLENEKIIELRKKYRNTSLYRNLWNNFPNSYRIEKTLLKGLISNRSSKSIVLSLPKEFLRLSISAYQSYLFNRVLSFIVC